VPLPSAATTFPTITSRAERIALVAAGYQGASGHSALAGAAIVSDPSAATITAAVIETSR
jgi:hypothetical protein